jgi:glycosyltransferase involved in cell wall biosynthesis
LVHNPLKFCNEGGVAPIGASAGIFKGDIVAPVQYVTKPAAKSLIKFGLMRQGNVPSGGGSSGGGGGGMPNQADMQNSLVRPGVGLTDFTNFAAGMAKGFTNFLPDVSSTIQRAGNYYNATIMGGYRKQIVIQGIPNLRYIQHTTEIKDIYSQTEIMIMPSKEETWGRTAVEAMSSGIPVIAHPTPGLLESCGKAGIFCDRDDIDSWIKEIRKLKTDSTYYEEKSKACLARARELDPEPQLVNMSKWLEQIKWKE